MNYVSQLRNQILSTGVQVLSKPPYLYRDRTHYKHISHILPAAFKSEGICKSKLNISATLRTKLFFFWLFHPMSHISVSRRGLVTQ